MSDPYAPTPSDRFTFGLWTVGNPGRDPFGDPVRVAPTPTEIVARLAKLGAFGVNLHDDDLVPFGSSASERDRIVKELKSALADHGMCVPMATTNLFTHPVFKDGAFTSNDARVRAFAIQKTMRAIDLGVELGAKIYVMWGGREGVEVDASKDPRDALRRYRDAIDFLCEYVRDNRYDLRFALEAKPNEPRSDIYLPTTGHMLAFIETLARPKMVGVNPEVAHEQMSGLSFHHGIAQALDRNKLFHIDLNDQKPGRYDQDLRFASESLKGMFFLVKLLSDAGYDGPKHFDAHAYRSEDADGVWEFARGCMRTYKILEDKARRFARDPEIQAALAEIRRHDDDSGLGLGEGGLRGYTRDKASRLADLALDPAALAKRGLAYERLDQLVVELLMGVR